jgi:Putative MetA-pathway of phenol degradation
MKRVILTVTLLFQGMALAQETAPSPAQGSLVEQAQISRMTNIAGFVFRRNWYGLGFAPPQQPNAQQRATQSPPPSTGTSRPRTEGSMIGYIENAIVGSQIRIRSDAGFGAQFPDRAEFFYAKCGCYQSNLAGSGLPAYDPNAPGPGPGVVTKLNFQQLYMQAEYAPHRRFSMFVEVPVRWIQPTAFVSGFGSFNNHAGLADVTAGFKAALLASRRHYLTVQLKAYFPSGDASQGLGTNHYSVEPSLLYYQALSDRLAVESEFGIWHPIGGSAGVVSASTSAPSSFAGNVIFYGVGPSYQLVRKERVRLAPVVEMVGWSVLGGYQTVWVSPTRIGDPASGTNILNIKIGARISLSHGNSFYIGYGRGLTDAVWYSDLVRVEYRLSFK